MRLYISTTNGVPPYQQIVTQVKTMVAAGRLRAGEELPPIRVLAEQLIVNPNTVAKAYRELEQLGLVVKRSTAGTFIAEMAEPLAKAECHKLLADRIVDLLVEAEQMNISVEEVIALVREQAKQNAQRYEES